MTVTTQRTTDQPTTTAAAPELALGTAPVEASPVDRPTVERGGRRLVALVGGLAVATVALVGTWAYVATRPAPTDWASMYGPASTTYTEQVPTAPWTSAYGEGSTTYAEQVPAAATGLSRLPAQGVATSEWPPRTTPSTDGYLAWGSPGLSEGPPRDPSAWTAGYGPGSAVWAEQVPQG